MTTNANIERLKQVLGLLNEANFELMRIKHDSDSIATQAINALTLDIVEAIELAKKFTNRAINFQD